MVLEIGVVDYNQFRVHMCQPGADSSPFALVFLMAYPDPAELRVRLLGFEGRAEPCDGIARSVVGTIVHYDNFRTDVMSPKQSLQFIYY